MKKIHTHLKGFSIIEVMVGLFIFSLGLVAIYTLLASSLNASDYSKNAIIASNLSREQLELFKNIRDTNYKKLNVWNQINPYDSYNASANLFNTGSYYKIENNFHSASNFSIKTELISGFKEGEEFLNQMENYRLCLSSDNIYTYDCSLGNTKTSFYRYLFMDITRDSSGNIIPDAYKVISKVIWYKRGYHEFDIQTIISDWRRI